MSFLGGSQPQDCLSYQPAAVTLKGVIARETFAGPPNYESIKDGDVPRDLLDTSR